MNSYIITKANVQVNGQAADLLTLKFGEPASNDVIVKDADAALSSLGLTGGKIVLLNGPASLPVAVNLSHGIGHLYGAVAVYDPKLQGYVVAVSHDKDYALGALIKADVKS